MQRAGTASGDVGMECGGARPALPLLLLLLTAAAATNTTRHRRPALVEDANGEDVVLPEEEDDPMPDDIDYYDENRLNLTG